MEPPILGGENEQVFLDTVIDDDVFRQSRILRMENEIKDTTGQYRMLRVAMETTYT